MAPGDALPRTTRARKSRALFADFTLLRPMTMPPTETHSFAGLRVAAFESRLAGPMAELIARHGGVPVIAPALREIALEENTEALACADRLLRGEFDLFVFLTGVGARFLAQAIETRVARTEWVNALGRIK